MKIIRKVKSLVCSVVLFFPLSCNFAFASVCDHVCSVLVCVHVSNKGLSSVFLPESFKITPQNGQGSGLSPTLFSSEVSNHFYLNYKKA